MRLRMYAKIRFCHSLFVLDLSSVICLQIHLLNAFILCQEYLSEKGFCTTKTILMSVNKTKLVNIGYRKSYKHIKRSKEN